VLSRFTTNLKRVLSSPFLLQKGMANDIGKDKEWAKSLFLDGLTRKEIAQKTGRTEKTIGKWVTDGNWEKMKQSLLVTKDNQINALYAQLETMNEEIRARPIMHDIPPHMLKPIKLKDAEGNEFLEWPVYNAKDYPVKIGNFPTSKEADIISKITVSINRLETETSLGEYIEVSKQLIQFVRKQDVEFASMLTKYCDALINEQLK
jgi:hypothetical protein